MDYLLVGLMFAGIFAFIGCGLHFGTKYINRMLGL